MKKIIFIVLITILTAAGPVFCLHIQVPESAGQGDVITVLLEDAESAVGLEIRLEKGSITYSETEFFSIVVEGLSVQTALLGVPSTLSPGSYSVAVYSGRMLETESTVIITDREFIRENIRLSSSMSTLRQSDDQKKAEQWRALLMILKTVEPEDVFETETLRVPVEALRKTSFYGDRRTFLYDDGSSARSIHTGIDYSAEPGTPVYAAGKGKVVFSDERILTGLTVVIEHLPGVYSLYYHMNSLEVEPEEIIKAGRLIGTVGATGLATGAHLHWELRAGGVAVNPESYIDASIIDKDFILGNIKRQ